LRNFYEICRKNADEFDEIDEAFCGAADSDRQT